MRPKQVLSQVPAELIVIGIVGEPRRCARSEKLAEDTLARRDETRRLKRPRTETAKPVTPYYICHDQSTAAKSIEASNSSGSRQINMVYPADPEFNCSNDKACAFCKQAEPCPLHSAQGCRRRGRDCRRSTLPDLAIYPTLIATRAIRSSARHRRRQGRSPQRAHARPRASGHVTGL
jgi:hypothetical protein